MTVSPKLLVLTQMPSGIETFVWRRVTALRRLQARVACFRRATKTQLPVEPVIEFASRMRPLKLVNSFLRRAGYFPYWDALEYNYALRRAIRRIQPDVLLCESGWPAARLGAAMRKTGLPFAVTFWGTDINCARNNPSYLKALRGAFDGGRLFIYCCDFLRRKGLELGCPPERSVTIYNGVEVPNELNWTPSPGGTFRLLCIARMTPVKGLDVLLRAVRMVVDAGVDLHLTHVGAGKLDKEIRALADELSLAERVRFMGELPNPAALSLCASSDALVLPSVRRISGQEETSPTVTAEAGAHGLPVIASNIGGVAETVIDGKTGILVPDQDPEALAAAITRLARCPAEARSLGTAGRKRVLESFEINRQVGKHEDALLRIIASEDNP